MTTSDERAFKTFPRGYVRDEIILQKFRNSLRTLVNPTTGVAFTEDEIARATQPGSRFYIEADAIDLYGQAMQARALFFADQVQPNRAATQFLENHHARLWLGDDPRLKATGGRGYCDADATPGSVFTGSTTIPDGSAAQARDPNGKRYQVLVTAVTPATGTVTLELGGIDTGIETNLPVDTVMTWAANQPLGAAPTFKVVERFVGGYAIETDSEMEKRVEDQIRNRPAAGNNAHMRYWTKKASSAVENGFVYACAFHAGTTLVCVVQKRSGASGPLARIPTASVLTDVTNFIVPPNAPTTPERVFVLVVPPQPVASDLVMTLGLANNTGGGWRDADPWPRYDALDTPTAITNVASQTSFTMTAPTSSLPGGAISLTAPDAPALMVWDEDLSRWEELQVASVSENTPPSNSYDVELLVAPTKTIAIGDHISPMTDQKDVIAETVEQYFDEIGPGEVVDLVNDVRGSRAFRFPLPTEENGPTAGAAVIADIIEALGGAVNDGVLQSISVTSPSLPTTISDGPEMIVLGKVSVLPL